MINQAKVDNLIAQTNYLSSMIQTYQSMLVKKFYEPEDIDGSRDSSSEVESIFEESEKVKNHEKNCFSESEHYNPQAIFSFSQDLFMDEAIVQEMADRPTAYTRTDETKKTKEKINVMEKSIQYCFEAI